VSVIVTLLICLFVYRLVLLCTTFPNYKRTQLFHKILHEALEANPLLTKSATYLGKQIKLGTISSLALVELFIGVMIFSLFKYFSFLKVMKKKISTLKL
jgi:hypothetical protein